MKELFHLFSDGSLSVDLFETEMELNAALNRIAVVAYTTGVTVLGFDIQDTHVHFLLGGEWSDVVEFKYEYQKRTRNRISRKKRHTDANLFELDILPVSDDNYARRAAAYVVCQATKDGKKVMPYDYKWSSAALYFRKGFRDAIWIMDNSGYMKKVVKMRDLSLNYHKYNLFSRCRLPDDWTVCDGVILPSSFVDIAGFEALFATHNAFRVFCGSSAAKDNEVREAMAYHSGICFEENEARQLAKAMCMEKFRIKDIRRLNSNQRLELAMALRTKYRIGISQIARRVYLPEQEVRRYLR